MFSFHWASITARFNRKEKKKLCCLQVSMEIRKGEGLCCWQESTSSCWTKSCSIHSGKDETGWNNDPTGVSGRFPTDIGGGKISPWGYWRTMWKFLQGNVGRRKEGLALANKLYCMEDSNIYLLSVQKVCRCNYNRGVLSNSKNNISVINAQTTNCGWLHSKVLQTLLLNSTCILKLRTTEYLARNTKSHSCVFKTWPQQT